MAQERPLILVSNDDSVEAPGFHHLIEAVGEFGDVIGVAPSAPRSGQSSAITVSTALRIFEDERFSTPETPIYSVNGTPVDCVKLAMHAIVPRRPSLVLAGMNHGSNSAVNVIYSGTMGAVIEGCLLGIPSIGFSLLSHSWKADLAPSTSVIKQVVKMVMEKGLPAGVCLNVNIPAHCEPLGIKVTRAARGYWTDEYADYTDPAGKPFYWLAGSFNNLESESDDTDEYWLARKWATIVPERVDMTALDVIDSLKTQLERSES